MARVDYRREAERCLTEAQQAVRPESKAVLLAMAEIWLRLARDKDRAAERLDRAIGRYRRPQ
jgi:Holliday junction resolvase-like predicted endonuclease